MGPLKDGAVTQVVYLDQQQIFEFRWAGKNLRKQHLEIEARTQFCCWSSKPMPRGTTRRIYV